MNSPHKKSNPPQALAIPIFSLVGILLVLVNFKVLHARDFPFVLYLKFTLEPTAEGLFWTAYNVMTSCCGLYFFHVAYRAYMVIRREKKREKQSVAKK